MTTFIAITVFFVILLKPTKNAIAMKFLEHSISFLKIANDHFTNSQHVIIWTYSTWAICFLNNTRVQKNILASC